MSQFSSVSLIHKIKNSNPVNLLFSSVLIVVFSFYLIYFFIFLVVSLLLIQGVKKRDHSKLVPYMIIVIAGIFMAFLNLLTMGASGLFLAFFWVAADIYLFLVVYSLYDTFKNERSGMSGRVEAPPITQSYGYPQQTVIYTNQPVEYAQPPPVQYQQPPVQYQLPIDGYQHEGPKPLGDPTAAGTSMSISNQMIDDKANEKNPSLMYWQ